MRLYQPNCHRAQTLGGRPVPGRFIRLATPLLYDLLWHALGQQTTGQPAWPQGDGQVHHRVLGSVCRDVVDHVPGGPRRRCRGRDRDRVAPATETPRLRGGDLAQGPRHG
jgi:hypothetical protein